MWEGFFCMGVIVFGFFLGVGFEGGVGGTFGLVL